MQILQEHHLSKFLKTLPLNYELYSKWLEEEGGDFLTIAVSNAEIRNIEEWNTLGREIYNPIALADLSKKIIAILRQLKIGNFIVKHEYRTNQWFPPRLLKKGNVNRELCDKFHVFQKEHDILTDFKGGFKIDQDMEVFLPTFIDYPFLLRYSNIDCFSLEVNMVLKITHHLEIHFISSDLEIIKQLRNYCIEFGLRCN